MSIWRRPRVSRSRAEGASGQLGGQAVARRSHGDGSLGGDTAHPPRGRAHSQGSRARRRVVPQPSLGPTGLLPEARRPVWGLGDSATVPSPHPRRTKPEAGTPGRKGPGSQPVPAGPSAGSHGPPGAALTMSYTLSTTNWLAPILLPAAAASSSSRSVSAGRRPLPPPRALLAGHEPGTKRPARPAAAGAEASGSRGRSREPLTETCVRTGPDRWRARSGSGASPRPQTRGGRRSLGEGRAPGALEAGPARHPG